MAVRTHRFMRHQAKSNFLLPLPLLLGAGNILFIVWDVGYSRYSFLRGFHEDINDSPLCCCFFSGQSRLKDKRATKGTEERRERGVQLGRREKQALAPAQGVDPVEKRFGLKDTFQPLWWIK